MTSLLVMLGLIAFGACLAVGAFLYGFSAGCRSREAVIRALQGRDPVPARRRSVPMDDETE